MYKHILVDGRNILFRTVASDLMKDEGTAPGAEAAFLFLRYLAHMQREFKGSRLIIALEGGHSPRRKSLLPEYKVRAPLEDADRKALYDKVYGQEPKVVEMLNVLGVCSIRVKDMEGDDIISACCDLLDGPILIASNDSDFYQLLNDQPKIIHMHRPSFNDPRESPIRTADWVRKNKGVDPRLWAVAKAIQGDKSDLIPGIPGVGEKTAQRLCEAIFHADMPRRMKHAEIIPLVATGSSASEDGRVRKIYEQGFAVFKRNLALVDLVNYPPTDVALESIKAQSAPPALPLDEKVVRSWLMQHRMFSVVAEWNQYAMPFFLARDAACTSS